MSLRSRRGPDKIEIKSGFHWDSPVRDEVPIKSGRSRDNDGMGGVIFITGIAIQTAGIEVL